jgi:hypothetical protein
MPVLDRHCVLSNTTSTPPTTAERAKATFSKSLASAYVPSISRLSHLEYILCGAIGSASDCYICSRSGGWKFEPSRGSFLFAKKRRYTRVTMWGPTTKPLLDGDYAAFI